MAKNINSSEYTEETMLKLDIFRKCFREWYPVFLHAPHITHLFIYDMFAGSGKDAVGNYGSPLILLQEARGENKQHCKHLYNVGKPIVVFGFNEKIRNKSIELQENIKAEQSACQEHCEYSSCPFINNIHVGAYDFQELIQNEQVNNVLSNRSYGKFVLLDQYGFKQINDEVFLKLINSPKTDFIFFIASSFIRRFKTLNAVTTYFHDNSIIFDESKPKECHRTITDYFRNLIPTDKEYYLHSFTIQKGSNYYGLIFGSNHTLGMEKFLKVCWSEDPLAGESNCNIYNDYEIGSLFYNPTSSNKKQDVSNIVKSKILNKEITSNIEGLKFVLSLGCEPKLFVDIVKELIAQNIVKIDGVFNRTSSNIHRASEYHIVLK
ncbi:MAG: three-Cys-motif partner protein TcmP [Muribaculaceae bacterium]|nr:three-Cys-motif partner protein TcmP [Muribaculaceae bacterium]